MTNQTDTQEVLAKFVPSFDARFIGLRGSLQETAETLGNFKIFYSKVPGKNKADYSIDHSAGMYVFDKDGKVRLYMGYGQKPAEIASDIRKLLYERFLNREQKLNEIVRLQPMQVW